METKMNKWEFRRNRWAAWKKAQAVKGLFPSWKVQFEGRCKVSGRHFTRFWTGTKYVEVGADTKVTRLGVK